MKSNEFLFRESFYKSISKLEDPSVRLAAYDLLCRFGVTGENLIESYPIDQGDRVRLAEFLEEWFSDIEKVKIHYEKCRENGRRGGLKGGKLGGRGNKKKPESASQTAQTNNTKVRVKGSV